jgi:hypothetical protein
LGLQFYFLKQKNIQIPFYLKNRFNPILKIKNMILDLRNIFIDDFTQEKLIQVEELLKKLDSFEI